jgi:nitroreductase
MKAAELGLGSCMIGWRDDKAIREICNLKSKTHLVISIGYPTEGDPIRNKVRKPIDELSTKLYG